jgi:hypothetical protein
MCMYSSSMNNLIRLFICCYNTFRSSQVRLDIVCVRMAVACKSFDLFGLVKPTPEWTHGNCFLFFLPCCE